VAREDEPYKNGPEGAIGVFDSGVGGLTVLREVAKALPDEDCIYLGDTARIPYGTKSKATVRRFALKNTEFLVKSGVKFLVVACNTAASAGLDHIRDAFDIPVIGVIHPGARRSATVTKNRKVGVIGTRSTVESGAYVRAIHEVSPDIQVFQKACPLFVPLAEEGLTEGEVTSLVAEEYLGGMVREEIDTLVLGCTHYPLLKKVIAETVGFDVAIVDSAAPVAREVAESLKRLELERWGVGGDTGPRHVKFFVTDDPASFVRVGGPFFGFDITDVEHVDIIV
jgi:glutamate racemase